MKLDPLEKHLLQEPITNFLPKYPTLKIKHLPKIKRCQSKEMINKRVKLKSRKKTSTFRKKLIFPIPSTTMNMKIKSQRVHECKEI